MIFLIAIVTVRSRTRARTRSATTENERSINVLQKLCLHVLAPRQGKQELAQSHLPGARSFRHREINTNPLTIDFVTSNSFLRLEKKQSSKKALLNLLLYLLWQHLPSDRNKRMRIHESVQSESKGIRIQVWMKTWGITHLSYPDNIKQRDTRTHTLLRFRGTVLMPSDLIFTSCLILRLEDYHRVYAWMYWGVSVL